MINLRAVPPNSLIFHNDCAVKKEAHPVICGQEGATEESDSILDIHTQKRRILPRSWKNSRPENKSQQPVSSIPPPLSQSHHDYGATFDSFSSQNPAWEAASPLPSWACTIFLLQQNASLNPSTAAHTFACILILHQHQGLTHGHSACSEPDNLLGEEHVRTHDLPLLDSKWSPSWPIPTKYL